ncbi:MAG TPA: hypothetical protein VMV90_13900 [Rectinemataceae bacterium]|nr:hypothetical protein [Rectinemataceae bacterium]
MKDVGAAQEFLDRLQPLLEAGALRFEPRNRKKTWEFMLAEGLGEEDAYDIVARLGPADYEWGPEPDDNGTVGDVMLFSCPFTRLLPPSDRIRLYIKLKIWTGIDGDTGLVMSFHEWGTV